MSDNPIGSESTADIAERVVPYVVSSGSVSGDAYASTLTTSGNRSTGSAELSTPAGPRNRSSVAKPTSKAKHKCYALFSACVDDLARALDHRDDFFLRNNALEQLKDTLSRLWSVRSEREEAFKEIVNLLQGVFAMRSVEDFAAEKLVCLKRVFEQIRDETVFDDDFANEVTVELLKGGIDVFREIE